MPRWLDRCDPLAFHLGLRYLRRRRAAWLALAAVTLTVAVPVAVMGVTQGWVDVMRAQVRANEGDLTITPGAYGMAEGADVEALAALPGVTGVAPFIENGAVLSPRPRRQADRTDSRLNIFVKIQGLDWEADRRLGRLESATLNVTPTLDLGLDPLPPDQRGSGFLTPDWRTHLALRGADLVAPLCLSPFAPQLKPLPGVLLGRELVYQHRGLHGILAPGERVRLVVPDGSGGKIGVVLAEVSTTVGTGVYEVDRLTAWLPLAEAQTLTDMAGRNPDSEGRREVSGYRLALAPGADHRPAAAAAADLGLQAWHWTELRGNLVRNLEVQRNILGFVMICVQLLCVFIIYAVFSTLVAEKRHDIGVLLGLGARRRSIGLAFLAAAVAICVTGGQLGWSIGWIILAGLNPFSAWTGIALFPQDVMYTPQAPISFDPAIPLLYIGVITAVGLLAALLPAWRASRIAPIETIRENG